jgi:formate dehydrogenase maturation protein FdhE
MGFGSLLWIFIHLEACNRAMDRLDNLNRFIWEKRMTKKRMHYVRGLPSNMDFKNVKICPICGSITRVVDSRVNGTIIRERYCSRCRKSFWTVEVMETDL